MLSDIQIRNAKPDAPRAIKLSDGGGLQLWVTPTGGKLWQVAYRFESKQRKLSLGPYPAVGLKAARDQREAAKLLLAAGIDPGQHKKAEAITKARSKANTFGLVADEVLAKKRREGLAENTLAKIGWLIDFARPTLGDRPIADITAPEILVVLRQVEARGRHETARRLRSTIDEVFRHAVADGKAASNPASALRGAITTPTTTPRAALIEPRAFGGLLRAIAGYDGTPETRAALQLLALTFVRPGELRGAAWEEFDLEGRAWTIPAARMKMRRPHKVPLATQSIEILEDLRQATGRGALLFPSVRTASRPMSEGTLGAALRRLGYTSDQMVPHGFRSVASTLLNECGKWNPDAIEAQLAHVEGNDVRRAYHRAAYWDERVTMMTYWADRVDALRDGGKVVALRA